ncbi:hypothetical protein CU098_013165 [Rhizopus stolonifer]|uniref:BTB domain-containing protein n=1 Tax=Rhizopus stolonifer TaxID=4846 RepID=A0A367KY24_RHIST|nr:hypothetical protein CU098_013165 [Rhizopus stolonifer]
MTTQHTHLSLTMIYQSLKSQQTPSQFRTASVKVWDHTFRHWRHYAKEKKWPTTKLIRCMDYMFTQGVTVSNDRSLLLELKSFHASLDWILHRFPEDPLCLQQHVKFLSNLLPLSPPSLHQLFSQHKTVRKLLSLVEQETPAIRFYCLRALAHLTLPSDAPARLTQLLGKSLESDQALMITRLLDQAQAEADEHLLTIWQATMDQTEKTAILYSLTSVIYKSASRSVQARRAITDLYPRWFLVLASLCDRWCHDLFIEQPTMAKEEERALLKFLNLARVIADILPQRAGYTQVKDTVDLLTSVLMAFLCQGSLAERHMNGWLDYQLCIEVDSRELRVDAETLQRHERLLAFLLDIYMQYIQLSPHELESAPVLAWCLKSFLLLLHQHNLTESTLLARLRKLIVYHLHNEQVIRVLVNAPKILSESIWSPTLELARQGLVNHTSAQVYKADRALVSLELIAKSARGCERLVEANVLDLVDHLHWSPLLFRLHSRLVRLMATLAGRSAYIRVRLREAQLFEKIKHLLASAVEHSSLDGCRRLIKGCLLVITCFQYDTVSMPQWLSENSVLPLVLDLVFPTDPKAESDLRALASYLLDQVMSYPLGVRQMIEHPQALAQLCQASIESSHYTHSLASAAQKILCENLQVPILANAYGVYFKPLIQRPRIQRDPYRSICQSLHEKRQDLESLYAFAQTNDKALKLHEMTAVAMGYASLGGSMEGNWLETLCDMLVYDLNESDVRQTTAAQVIEIITLDFSWTVSPSKPLEIEKVGEGEEPVWFVTDDGQQLKTNRELLRHVSPIFSALLSKDYGESEMARIVLHDVTHKGLKEFVDMVYRLNAQEALSRDYDWSDLVTVLKLADRFGCRPIERMCKNWVLVHVKEMEEKSSEERRRCLEGLIELYRECVDPLEPDGGIQSSIWPFSNILNVSLKTILQYLTEACQTNGFLAMKSAKKMEELEAFCVGITTLLNKKEISES